MGASAGFARARTQPVATCRKGGSGGKPEVSPRERAAGERRSRLELPGVERALDELHDLLLGCGTVVVLEPLAFRPDRERELETPSADGVERLLQERDVLRLLGLGAEERRLRRKLDRQHLAVECGRVPLGEEDG